MDQLRLIPIKYAIHKAVLPQSPDEEYASKLYFAAQLIEQLRAVGIECEMSGETPARTM
jgi:hypothetical protein